MAHVILQGLPEDGELIEAPVAHLSTYPERDDTILVKDPFRQLARDLID